MSSRDNRSDHYAEEEKDTIRLNFLQLNSETMIISHPVELKHLLKSTNLTLTRRKNQIFSLFVVFTFLTNEKKLLVMTKIKLIWIKENLS